MPTKHFTIFGDPVEHSLSPTMHGYAIEGLGLQADYTKTHLTEACQMRAQFMAHFDGANVTVPHKEAAYAQADEVRGIAQEIKAVNTLIKEGENMIGYNTDAEGFWLSMQRDFPDVKSALILGAGGTAKAIAHILTQKGIDLTILNRSAQRLEQLKAFECYTWENFTPKAYDIIINTTSAGLEDATPPTPLKILNPLLDQARYAHDVIYNRQTPFLQLAKTHDLPAKDGADMLLFQGVLAFNLFYQNRFDPAEIERYMRKAFD